MELKNIEYHPLKPFLQSDSRLLLLGSFPPKKERWSMDFFYPNLQNDMWRIFGLIFFKNKDYFLSADRKSFNKKEIEKFLIEKKIAIYDVAKAVIRHKDNASDNFLEIKEATDLNSILHCMPYCISVVTTGQKASETVSSIMNIDSPKIGNYTEFIFNNRIINFYRMPSSSRAYPLALEKKASIYKGMFEQLNII